MGLDFHKRGESEHEEIASQLLTEFVKSATMG